MVKIVLVLITMFYLSYLYIDLFNHRYFQLSDYIKYICIILCFVLSLLIRNSSFDEHDVKLLQIGLFLTVIADFFLLILNDHYAVGVSIFTVAQVTYSIRYNVKNKRSTIKNYIVIFGTVFLVYAIINRFVKMDLILPISLCYGICLIVNVHKSIVIFKQNLYPKPNGAMIAFGMVLFLLCDMNVALYNIFKYASQTDGIMYRISSVSMWLYYLPSQVLLALSGYEFEKQGGKSCE